MSQTIKQTWHIEVKALQHFEENILLLIYFGICWICTHAFINFPILSPFLPYALLTLWTHAKWFHLQLLQIFLGLFFPLKHSPFSLPLSFDWMRRRKRSTRCCGCSCSRSWSCLTPTRARSRSTQIHSTREKSRIWSRGCPSAGPCWNRGLEPFVTRVHSKAS